MVDLATHASRQTLDLILRIADAAPNPEVKAYTAVIAYAILAGEFDAMAELTMADDPALTRILTKTRFHAKQAFLTQRSKFVASNAKP